MIVENRSFFPSLTGIFDLEIKEPTPAMVQEIANRALKEFAVVLSFTAVTSLFVATPIGVSALVVDAVSVVAINLVFRFALKSIDNKYEILEYLPAVVFTLFDQDTRGIVVHESGHAMAALFLYHTQGLPSIEVIPGGTLFKRAFSAFTGVFSSDGSSGMTRFRVKGFTVIGEWLGRTNCRIVVAAAGAAAAVGVATFSLIQAHRMKESNPELSRYLNTTAIATVISHVEYAYSAIGTKSTNLSHDFIHLAFLGVSPVVCITTIVAIPVIVKLGLVVFHK